MNILFVAHFAGSAKHGMVYGHYHLAKEWVKRGHTVTILAASFVHTRSTQPKTDGWITEEFVDGIRYLWLRTPSYRPSSSIGRLRSIFSFLLKSWFVQVTGPHPDVVICSSHYPLAIFPARKLARKSAATLVFEVRDLWPLTLIELGGASSRHPFIRLMQWAEDFAYRESDKVVSVLSHSKDYMVSRGMDPTKFIFVPNGIDTDQHEERYRLPNTHVEILDRLKKSNKFIVGYAGKVGLSNELQTLIRSLAIYNDPDVHVVILGDGDYLRALQELVNSVGVADRVTFLGHVLRNQIPCFLGYLDAAYVGLALKGLFRFGISPTKVGDYMLAAVPVIYAVEAPGDVVAEADAGITCSPENPKNVAEAIEKLKRLTEQERLEMGARGRAWVLENRNYEILADNFLNGIVME